MGLAGLQGRVHVRQMWIWGPGGVCWGQIACVPQNLYVEIMAPKVVVLGRGAFGVMRVEPPEWDQHPGEGPRASPTPPPV